MKNKLFLFFICLCFVSAFTQYNDYEDESGVRLAVTPMATFSIPIWKFGDNYAGNSGGGLKININSDYNGKIGTNFGLFWNYDRMKIKGQGENADLNTVVINVDYYLFFLTSGASAGMSHFKISAAAFNKFGSTGTELKHENGEWQFDYSRYFGLRIPAGEYFAIEANYNLITVERVWMYWHSMLSGAIKGITVMPFNEIAKNLAKKDRIAPAIFFKAIGVGMSFAWYYYDYKHHNWPWHEDPPLRYHKITLGFTTLIPIRSR